MKLNFGIYRKINRNKKSSDRKLFKIGLIICVSEKKKKAMNSKSLQAHCDTVFLTRFDAL